MSRWSIVLMALSITACASARPRTEPLGAAHEPILVSTHELGRPFVVRQVLRGHYGKREISAEVVVQLADGTLTLVGLTPFGTRGFVLEQVGTNVRFTKLVDRDLPFDPRYLLEDVHRVFFRGLSGSVREGARELVERGERVRERSQHGHVVERTFESLGAPGEAKVTVSFEGAPAPVIAPKVKIENARFGYRIEIENVTQAWL